VKEYRKIIRNSADFNSIIDNIISKNGMVNYCGFYTKRLIYLNVFCVKLKETILLILDLNDLSTNFYVKSLQQIKELYNKYM